MAYEATVEAAKRAIRSKQGALWGQDDTVPPGRLCRVERTIGGRYDRLRRVVNAIRDDRTKTCRDGSGIGTEDKG